MASTVAIMNAAAVLIGTESRVTDPADERPLATTLREVWDIERQATLRDGAWNFAVKRRELMAVVLQSGETIHPWSAAYKLPADCLKLIEILGSWGRADYQLEGSRILCNAGAPLRIRYCADVSEPAEWDPAFARAFACRLALVCGNRIAGSVYDASLGAQLYREALTHARLNDALENPRIEFEESDWILARHGTFAPVPFGSDYPG